jgi:cytochrome oxidase Cu insertion factor (SCO1/SenC/PrrC family)
MLLAGAFCRIESALAQIPSQLPEFGMTLSNGRYFRSAELQKNTPVLLIYFAPDCDHCHTLMNELFQRANDFKPATVLLVTYKPVAELSAFEQAYKAFEYPFIKVGTEGTGFFLRQFYKIQQTPFTALYNRKGQLVSSYRKTTPLGEISKQLKKL